MRWIENLFRVRYAVVLIPLNTTEAVKIEKSFHIWKWSAENYAESLSGIRDKLDLTTAYAIRVEKI